MSTSFLSLSENINLVRYNPSAMNRFIFRNLEDLTSGKRVLCDATNPLAFGIDSACATVSAFMTQNRVLNRQQYPSAAQTWEDLYYHMSDKDYLNRFALPSKTKFTILLSVKEILERAVQTDNPNIRKLVIPRNTFFTVADVKFSISYPIEIRIVADGGMTIVYDISQQSPLTKVRSNWIQPAFSDNAGITWVSFQVDALQYDIVTRRGSLNLASGFKSTVTLTDQFYFARVWVQNEQNGWTEMRTTHASEQYDVTTPTAVLRLVDKELTVEIPQIYTSTILRGRSVRIDAYQTKGPLSMILDNYEFNRFRATFLAVDAAEDSEFVAPLKSFQNIAVFSRELVTGGTNGLTFTQMRERVMKNAVQFSIPITNIQIAAALVDNGYDIVKNTDLLTNRVFLATRELPAPVIPDQTTTDNKNVVSAAAMSMETVSASFASLITLDTVINNGDRLTITPETLYTVVGGLVRPMTNEEVARVTGLYPEAQAINVTDNKYLFTPFHYVLDTTEAEFSSRAYYLNAPAVLSKSSLEENPTTLLSVSTDQYEFRRTPNGYTLQVITKSNAGFKELPDDQVHVEVAFIPPGERDYAHLLGTLVGYTEDQERVFNFAFDTQFDINRNDQLVLNSFLLYSEETHKTPANLTTEFMLFWSVSSVMPDGYVRYPMDDLIGTFELPSRIAAVAQESIEIEFGDSLKRLWSRGRSVKSSVPYKTWGVDIPWLYEEDEYEKDVNGNIGQIIDGEFVYKKLASKGDVRMVEDESGALVPYIRYYAGTTMFDSGGQPIPAETQGMTRQIDMLFIEGAYWFATEALSVEYLKTITRLLTGWLTEDLVDIQGDLLEITRLYFYPKASMGNIDVMVLDGMTTSMEAGQDFQVQVTVSEQVYKDKRLQAKMERMMIQVISNHLKKIRVSHSEIIEELQEKFQDDIQGITLSMFGNGKNVDVVTVSNDATRLTIGKRLAALGDGSLSVQDNVTFTWIGHTKRT